MYKQTDNSDISFLDFNQTLGLHLDPENRWVRLAALIPWDEYESQYSDLFKSRTGNVAKSFRMALGARIIQMKYDCSYRELVEQITENPYLQYIIGLPHFQYDPPFDPSLMVAFRKRIDLDVSFFLNEEFLKKHNGEKLGRPQASLSQEEKKLEYKDNIDRIKVERSFSLSKICYGLGLIKCKLEETTYSNIGMSIFVTNLFKVLNRLGICTLFLFVVLKARISGISEHRKIQKYEYCLAV